MRLNVFKKYINLGNVNDSLARENAKLNTELLALRTIDTAKDVVVKDTLTNIRYTYISARIVKNSVTLRNNIITIDKGSADGIKSGMAVISPGKGVVGFIRDVTPHLANITSLLHKDTYISVSLKKNNAVGSLVWGEGNFDYRKAYIQEIPNHFKIGMRDTVVTSGYSAFPAGIPVGRVSNTGISKGENFMTIEIDLFNDFSNLQYVYVVKDKLALEQKELEDKLDNEQ
jgi:rod shape-determining protein MreC